MTDKKEKIISLNKNKEHKETYTLGELLPQIFTSFAKDLKPKLITCFELLDDTLFDLAEKAESNKNQTLYFESMRQVRKSRGKMFSVFFNSIKSTFRSFKKSEFDFFEVDASYNKKTKSLALSLIDEKELDETLAKSNLINKSEMAYHRHLFAFRKRFSLLASGTKLKVNQIPISPYVLVNSFAKCISSLDLEVTLKLIMYKLFERNVMGQLNEPYNHINNFLADKGIIPEIKYNIGRANSGMLGTGITAQPQHHGLEQSNQGSMDNSQNSQQIYNSNHPNSQHVDSNYQLISQLFKHSHQQDTTVG
ncbi:hypothetical protein MNBD_GAMMA03-850, partial [hydrothermal vent metagenome]